MYAVKVLTVASDDGMVMLPDVTVLFGSVGDSSMDASDFAGLAADAISSGPWRTEPDPDDVILRQRWGWGM